MANKIILKKSSVAAKVPLSTDLEVGEIAVNLVDQKLYSKKADGTVVLVGTGSGGAGDVVGAASSTDNAVTRFDGTTGKLIQNSAVIIDDSNNVTGVNSLTATTLVVNDNATLGSSNTDTLAVNARITTDLDPDANNAKDIGTSGRNWRDGFFGRTLSTVNLELTGTASFDGAQGTSGQVLTSAGTGNTPTWTTPAAGTVTAVTGTAPVVSSGGTTPAISMAAATTSVNGYLTSTDWNTFNNKTSNTGTVTSVGGTGTVNGISLSGTVTTSGNLTLGGTLSGVNLTTQVTGTLPVANGGTGITSFGSGVATFLGTPSSANLAAAVTGETGSGALVFGTSPTLSGATLNDGFTEEVFAVTGTTPALSPTNGSIQTWTLSGNSTPTAGTWAAGQSLTLMIDDGTAFTVTWSSLPVTWSGGSAPTLATSGYTVIELWKVGTTIYGALVGTVA